MPLSAARIHVLASHLHYLDHLAPIWRALPEEVRGVVARDPIRLPAGGIVLVASEADAARLPKRRLVHVDHGAGQSYLGVDHPAYAGGRGLPSGVELFLSPGHDVARRWSDRYAVEARAIGCPKLDRWLGEHRQRDRVSVLAGGADEHPVASVEGVEELLEPHHLRLPEEELAGAGGVFVGAARPPKAGLADPLGQAALPAHGRRRGVVGVPGEAPRAPVVAVTFHWNCLIAPETRSALGHYPITVWRALRDALAAQGATLLGHGHPKSWRTFERLWRALGVPYTTSLAEVFDRADVLVADNTSAMFEMAALGRPIVALNAPWYRRDVEHGLRFWSHVPGVQVDGPSELVDAVVATLDDPHGGAELRRRAVDHVYAFLDGRASERAATALLRLLR